MKKTAFVIFIALAGFLLMQSCGTDVTPAQTNNETTTQPSVGASVDGKILYEEKCTVCHGGDGKQNTMGAKDLSASTINHETIVGIITSGKNAMKGFSPELNAEQIEAVAKYVETLRK